MSRSGTLSRMHSRGQIRRARPNRDPLRKIVAFENGLVPLQVLECGHKMHARQDFIGEVPASIGSRRRCGYCAKAEGR